MILAGLGIDRIGLSDLYLGRRVLDRLTKRGQDREAGQLVLPRPYRERSFAEHVDY